MRLWMTLLVGMSTTAMATGQLPIGERKYVIDTDDEFKPVEITKREAPVKKTYLKDPNLNDLGKLAQPIEKPGKKTKKVVKKKKSDPQAIVFNPLPVEGQTTQPRVKFTTERLDVGRADEPLNADFFDKVFAPATDKDF